MSIDQIKEQLSILAVLNHYGLAVNKNGMVNCPFHQDGKASMKVYAATNTVYCFAGGCEVNNLDQIDFILRIERSSKHEAILKAKELLGYLPQNTSKEFSTSYPVSKQKLTMNIDFSLYLAAMKKSKAAQKYCESRCLDWKNLGIGYKSKTSPDKWGRGCIVFGLRDAEENIVSLYGRSISSNNHYYQSGRRGLYPKYPEGETQTLILCESIIDAASLYALSLPLSEYSVLALYGTNGLTEEHMETIQKLNQLKEVVFALDGDVAGDKAVESCRVALEQRSTKLASITYSRLRMPSGEDLNSLRVGHSDWAGLAKDLFESRALLKEEKQTLEPFLDLSNEQYIEYLQLPLKVVLLGGVKWEVLDRLRLTLQISLEPLLSAVHSLRQTVDLYNDDQLQKLVRKVSERLNLGTPVVQECLSGLVQALNQEQRRRLESQSFSKVKKRELTEAQRAKAKDYLAAPDLLKRTNADIGKTGVVGELKNRLIVYLCYTSRTRSKPLHLVMMGSSGSGKTYLQEMVGALIPEEDILQFTSATENALYYIKDGDLSHKVIMIEDLDGAEGSLYILRELMSKRMVIKLVPMKQPNGKIETVRIPVEGPICLSATTTMERLYEDNANRALLLSPDGGAEQQAAILAQQRKESAGSFDAKGQQELRAFFKDIQTVLEPIEVRNPYAEQLRIPVECFKPLRTQLHYLHFIETVTFYHQYQREVKTDPRTKEAYIETTLEDIAAANDLLEEVLLRKSDELGSEACRRFYERLQVWLSKENRSSFYSREVRECFRMAPRTVRHYLRELRDYGMVKVLGGNRYHQGLEYSIATEQSYEGLRSKVRSVLRQALEQLRKEKK